MKNIILAILAVLALSTMGCTENIRTKTLGGTMTVTLPEGQKLINSTWKDAQLWYLTRPMYSNEVAETYTFTEKSSFGMVEGKIIFIEQK